MAPCRQYDYRARSHNRRPVEVDGYTAFVRSPKLCRLGSRFIQWWAPISAFLDISRVVASHGCSQSIFSSTKAYYSHSLGASAPIEGILCTLVHFASAWFRSSDLNYEEPDPACGLDVVPNQPRENCSLPSKSPAGLGSP
jgi:hypothetical protein